MARLLSVTDSSRSADHATTHADAAARAVVDRIPRLALADSQPTPIEELGRLRESLGMRPRLLVKRDDVLTFGAGGNKVRKLEVIAARATAEGADTLVTTGGVQSNHARVTAAAAARLGLDCILVVNGEPPAHATGNALLMQLFGAKMDYVATRQERAPRVEHVIDRLHAEGRRPCAIPLGASTATCALGYVRAIGELLTQMAAPPDVIIHSSSSGGTQAGLIAGCALFGLHTKVIGVSPDDPSAAIAGYVRPILTGLESELKVGAGTIASREITVEDRFVGGGYGVPSDASREAIELTARREGLLLDPVYSAKAMAALIAYARAGELDAYGTVLFWHTGGVPGLFA
jgi:1-aminocyclopropane-1-carboxylate deaminase/D-cysteine desulfhydrase-like pyridoxal-dependent ACC family enzyme